HAPLRDADQTGCHAHRRRLAGTVRAEERHDRSVGDLERDAVDRARGTKGADEMVETDQACFCSACFSLASARRSMLSSASTAGAGDFFASINARAPRTSFARLKPTAAT